MIGRFVPYHLCCAYGLTEARRDRLLVRIAPAYRNLKVPQGFTFEMEPFFRIMLVLSSTTWTRFSRRWPILSASYVRALRSCLPSTTSTAYSG